MSAMRNGSGYISPTENAAIYSIEQEMDADSRASALFSIMRRLIDLCGFTLMKRIEIRDKATGKEYV